MKDNFLRLLFYGAIAYFFGIEAALLTLVVIMLVFG